eukprot:5017652-Pyramimonas_sp.AAC.1
MSINAVKNIPFLSVLGLLIHLPSPCAGSKADALPPQSTRIIRTHGKGARTLEGHADTLRAERGQR